MPLSMAILFRIKTFSIFLKKFYTEKNNRDYLKKKNLLKFKKYATNSNIQFCLKLIIFQSFVIVKGAI
jgi:hypothetical protein